MRLETNMDDGALRVTTVWGIITRLTIIINVQITVQVLVEVNSVICRTAFPWSDTEQRMCAIILVEIT